MTKTPGQVLLEALEQCDGYENAAAAVIAAARPQIEAEMTANMHHFADTVIEKLKGQIEAEARAAMAEQVIVAIRKPGEHSWDEIRALAALPSTHQVVPVSVAKFAAWLIRESRENMRGFDGGELQDRMVSDGVLVECAAIEPCGENCNCDQIGFPAYCYRLTDEVKAMLAASKGKT